MIQVIFHEIDASFYILVSNQNVTTDCNSIYALILYIELFQKEIDIQPLHSTLKLVF